MILIGTKVMTQNVKVKKMQICVFVQNHRTSVSEDDYTYSKKMAGNGCKIVFYQYLSFTIRLYLGYKKESALHSMVS